MTVTIQPGCIGCTLCASTCPEVFAMGPDGLATVAAQPGPAQEDGTRAAAENCPVSVIEAV